MALTSNASVGRSCTSGRQQRLSPAQKRHRQIVAEERFRENLARMVLERQHERSIIVSLMGGSHLVAFSPKKSDLSQWEDDYLRKMNERRRQLGSPTIHLHLPDYCYEAIRLMDYALHQ